MKEIISMVLLPDIRFLRLAASAGVEAARYAARSVPEGGVNESVFLDEVELAVSEIFTNAVRHGDMTSAAQAVRINFSFGSGMLRVKVTDRNPDFDPDSIPAPDITTYPQGGYGLFLVRQVMDSVCRRRKGGENTIIMTKKILGKDPS